ncbi:hypothetical protein Goari_022479, partial [Gossypium aridum]|nr:hypothetical protein [Gossypium aridum]
MSSVSQIELVSPINPNSTTFDALGHLSSGIFDDISKLQVLNLRANNISGGIPNSLIKRKELTYLSLHDNSLEGSIPLEIGNLTKLEFLLLGLNNLE